MKIVTFAEILAAGCPDAVPAPSDEAAVVSVIDLLADAAEDGGWRHIEEYAIDVALTGGRLPSWGETADKLRALAARLRGAR